jgi:hypothetical protein
MKIYQVGNKSGEREKSMHAKPYLKDVKRWVLEKHDP